MPKKIDLEKESTQILKELLKLIGIKGEVVSNLSTENGENVINMEILAPEESGILIGAKGSNLNALQSFVAMALRQKTGEWTRVSLDVGEWRARHADYLKSLANQAAERARSTGEPQYLYNLTPFQRRIVHTHLSGFDDIVTQSEGEGASRFLVVKTK